MDREQLIARFTDAGVDRAVFESVPTATIEALAKALLVPDDLARDDEEEKVAAHAERFSEDFARFGTSRGDLVAAYRARRRQEPGLTAAAFLGRG